MLQGKTVKIQSGGDYAPLPDGVYTVQIADVEAVEQLNYNRTQMETRLKYKFVILSDKEMLDSEKQKVTTRGRFLWDRVRPVSGANSHFTKLAKAAMGRSLEKPEVEALDPESLVGKQLQVQTEQKPGKKNPEKIYTNIGNYMPVETELEPIDEIVATTSTTPVAKPSKTVSAPIQQETDPDEYMSKLDAELAGEETPEAKAKRLEQELAALKAKT